MPLYTYECPEHGQFDDLRSIHDDTIMLCPQCHKTVIKILSPVRTVSRGTKMGQTRGELFQNLGKEGWAGNDMWKSDQHTTEESFRSGGKG